MTRMMLEIEAEYQPVVDALMQGVAQVRGRRQQARGSGAMDDGQVEQEMAQGVAELERAAHAMMLSGLDIDAPQVVVDGQLYRRVLRSPGSYYTMAGAVQVERTLYRRASERNGETVDAIWLRAGVVGQGWLPQRATTMAWECQRAPSREAEAASHKWQRLPYARSAFETVAHQVGEQ